MMRWAQLQSYARNNSSKSAGLRAPPLLRLSGLQLGKNVWRRSGRNSHQRGVHPRGEGEGKAGAAPREALGAPGGSE